MKTTTKTIYVFDELSDEAKQMAFAWYKKASYGDEWWEFVYEDAEMIGLKISGFDIGRGNKITGEFEKTPYQVAKAIIKEHGESCATYKIAMAFLEAQKELSVEDDGELTPEAEDTLSAIKGQFKEALLEEYLSLLRKEYDYQTSDETISENIRVNEYTFDEDGRREG